MSIAIAVAFVQSRLDYSNSLLFGTASYNINKLKHVQNLAAKLALNNWHSSSKCLLDKLHWLPVQSRIQFKIATLTYSYKTLSHNQPSYLRSLLTPYNPLRPLRSSDQNHCFPCHAPTLSSASELSATLLHQSGIQSH